jgi:predicted ATPase
MPDLPTGTVTFLFTDIEGSTRLLQERGEGYRDLLAEHRRVLREAFERHGGIEVDTQGDAFFVAFGRATDAVAAAEDAQRQLELPVRMGIHTGEPQLTAEGYVGIDVHRAARICAAAHGGQVVLSEHALIDRGAVKDLGLHRLKDLQEPERLYQLGEAEFPPLRSLNATNLPVQPNPLVGRESELSELTELVRAERVVTLTGPGGSGKTRLALQAAAESVEAFVDGVFWVPLAAVTDPEIVESSIGDVIGAQNGAAGHIDEKRMLLLLDNLEQLLPGAAPPLAGLAESCPNLRLLVTSRAPLRIAAEREFAVDPLPEPDAVTLFRERAFLSEPEGAVFEICRRLDGLPLAIELAAARTRLLPPERLLARLEQALPVLTGGRRDAPERQRTLRATIEWSYDLLDQDERLFARLAVFAGSFEAEAAETICDGDLDKLEALVEHSLLRRWASGRLGMLETIRELAVEKLEESGDAESIRRQHAEFFLEVAESSGLRLDTLGKLPQRHDLVLPELHNLRAAMDWAAENDPELGLRIAIGIENIWVTHDPREGIRRFETLLERAVDVDPDLRARALIDLGGCSEWSGDEKKGRTAYEEALALRRQLGDQRGVAEARFRLGVVDAREGDLASARARWEQSLEEWRRLGDEAGVAQGLGNLGWLAFMEGDLQRARELTEQGLLIARRLGWTWWEVGGLGSLAEIELSKGNVEEGEQLAREGLELSSRIEDRTHTLYGLAEVAWAAALRGDGERAARLWASVEAELERVPDALLEKEREIFAARMPDGVEASPLELAEAIEYALADA